MSHGGGSPILKFIEANFGMKLFDLKSWSEAMGDWGISRALFLSTIFVSEYFVLAHLIPNLPTFTINWLIGTAPLWLPIVLIYGFWKVWIWYIQSLYLSGRNPVLLEMRMPREVTKSPRAMEIALANFWINSGETTFLHRGWRGQVRPFFSFEIASFGGDVRFFVWCWKNYVHTVQEALYGMYPEVEVMEVEDYASKFQLDLSRHNVFATDWRLESARGQGRKYGAGKFRIEDMYAIKTYVDFELDKDPKEELKVDPMSSVMEFLSSLHPFEQIWVQFIVRRCGKYGILIVNERDDEWKHEMMNEVELIRHQANKVPGTEDIKSYDDLVKAASGEDSSHQKFPNPTPRHKQMMESIDRNMAKLPFEFLGRGIYIATDHDLVGPTYTHMRWMWKPMGNSAYGTHLRPRRWHNYFDYPWQDVANIRWNRHVRFALDAYRRRSAFHSPWIIPTDVMTNESLATIWRPLSSTVTAPGLRRIPAKKAEPPANLPKMASAHH